MYIDCKKGLKMYLNFFGVFLIFYSKISKKSSFCALQGARTPSSFKTYSYEILDLGPPVNA